MIIKRLKLHKLQLYFEKKKIFVLIQPWWSPTMKLCSFNLIYLFNISLCVVLLKAHLLFAWYCTFEYDDQKYLDPFSEYVKVGPKCLKEEVSKKKLSPRNHLVPMALGSLRWLLRCLKVIWPLQVLSDHSK